MPDPFEGYAQPFEQKDPFAGFAAPLAKTPSNVPPATDLTKPENWQKVGESYAQGRGPLRAPDISTGMRSLIQSPEDFAVAYGFKPEDFDPRDLAKEYNLYKGEQGGRVKGLAAFGLGAKHGLEAPVTGGRQLIGHTVGTQNYQNISDLRARWAQDIYEQRTKDSKLSATLGEVTGSLPYAALTPELEAAPMVGAALGGAAFGAVQPVASPDYWRQKAINTVVSSAAAPLTMAGLRGLIAGGTKTVAGARGLATGWLPEESAALQNEITKTLGIPKSNITAADLLVRGGKGVPASRIRKARDLIAKSPYSDLSTVNAENQAAAETALGKLGAAAETRLESTPFEDIQALRAAADAGDKQAKWLVENMPAPSDISPGKNLQFDIQLQKWRGAQQYNPLYEAARAIEPTASNDVAPVLGAIEEQIAKASGEGKSAKLKGVIDFLNMVKQDLSPNAEQVAALRNAGIPEDRIADVMNANGITATGLTDLGGLKTIRDNISGEIERAMKGSADAITGSNKTHYLTEVKNALDAVIDAAGATPEGQAYTQALGAANEMYAAKGAPFKSSLVSGLVKKGGEPVVPDVAAGTLAGMTPGETAQVAGVLGERGKAAHFAQLARDVVNAGINPSAQPGMQFDRLGFLGAANDLGANLSQVSTQANAAYINSLKEIMQFMDQIGKTQTHIMGGENWYKWIGGAASLLKPLMQSDSGKAILLTISATKDPALKGTLIQKALQFAENKAPKAFASTLNENRGNPINMPE